MIKLISFFFTFAAITGCQPAYIQDQLTPLPLNSIHFSGFLESYLQNSIKNWNKGVVPYSGFVLKFRTVREFFAQGEMWGKAVRSGCMFYRYTQDPELKKILETTVNDLLTTRRENGSISCSVVSQQPDGPGGDLWERKYVLLEQTNPDMRRMMETCVGVTWLKFCSQILRLQGDPFAVDMIEKYAYNGLIGAMKPAGDGFSYVNLLNGVKTNQEGWGGYVDSVYVTCCNLNGPMGLAYLPFVAVMNSKQGPVINLYNAGVSNVLTPDNHSINLNIVTDYPLSGAIIVSVAPQQPEKFSIRLRIPAWSQATILKVNGEVVKVVPGTYAEIYRVWSSGDKIELMLDMRCRVINAPQGSNSAGDNYQALIRGPVVLARDENMDSDYNKPVAFISKDGYVDVIPEFPAQQHTKMQFLVPTAGGYIHMVDYASVDSWKGKQICTWVLKK